MYVCKVLPNAKYDAILYSLGFILSPRIQNLTINCESAEYVLTHSRLKSPHFDRFIQSTKDHPYNDSVQKADTTMWQNLYSIARLPGLETRTIQN